MVESLIDALTALWFGMLGACVGSFLNVVAYRLPLGMSVVWKPSHCPRCQHAIRARDNIPVLGWLLLRGCCRDCQQPIAARYAIVESILGLIFFLLAYTELFRGGANLPGGPMTLLVGAIDNVWYPNWPLIGLTCYHGVLMSLLMAWLLIDLDEHRVPPRLVVTGLVFGLLPPAVWPWLHPTLRVQGGVDLIYLLFYLFVSEILGVVLGTGIAALLSNLGQSMRHPKNFVFALAIVGLFLGWQAVLTTAAGALATLGILHIFLQRWPKLHASAPMVGLLIATLGQIVFWDQMVKIFP
jgi:leader peptidase (prepilin peptidase)/N-methyltransferase